MEKTKSYAVIDGIEDGIARCEVELIPVEISNSQDYFNHENTMISIMAEFVKSAIGNIEENDVIIVEHDGVTINHVLARADDEKTRREAVYDAIMN